MTNVEGNIPYSYQLAYEWLTIFKGNINKAKDRGDKSLFLIQDNAWQWAEAKWVRQHTSSNP